MLFVKIAQEFSKSKNFDFCVQAANFLDFRKVIYDYMRRIQNIGVIDLIYGLLNLIWGR